MAGILTSDATLCECCGFVVANGDDSGCRDYHGHDEHAMTAPRYDGIYVVGDSYDHLRPRPEMCDGCGQDQLFGATLFRATVLER